MLLSRGRRAGRIVDATGAVRRSPRTRLLAGSFLMLFVELVLIRWSAANVVYLATFTNFILLASFLGIGIGFLRAGREGEVGGVGRFRLAPAAIALYAGFVLLFPVSVGRGAEGRVYRGLLGLPVLPQWVVLPVLFVGSAAVLALIAEAVARQFPHFKPLTAYRLDILGSLGGILAFAALSFLHAGPFVWSLVIVAGAWFLLEPPVGIARRAALVAVVALLGLQSFLPGHVWSPYYKVVVRPSTGAGTTITVNNVPHQTIRSRQVLEEGEAIYFVPYRRLAREEPGRVLIVGAGTGNDVAVALDEGATSVDAVEIDPALQRIGVEEHPDRPYEDPRVSVHIDDGRAFLRRTDRTYDLILFALPDSLTAVSQSALRLESFLFTEEGIEAARSRLAPGGVFSMYNYYRPLVMDRFASTIHAAFDRRPCLDVGEAFGDRQQAVLTVGLRPEDVECRQVWRPTGGEVLPASTDDHPFIYLPERRIPSFYLWALALMLAASALAIRAVAGPLRMMRGYVDLFCMGAAFLLLETKNVVQFALLFGTTWFVNALVFAGVLVSVLAAIEVARRFRLPRHEILFAVLGLALLVAWLVPQEALVSLPVGLRFLAATVLAFTPIFIANVVFAQRFRDVGSSVIAFGANLLGAMLGGVLEYGALVTGYRTLLIVVGAVYALAFITRPREAAIA